MIKNGSDKKFNEQATSQLPNMGSVLSSWLQTLSIEKVTTVIEDYIAVETKEVFTFYGVWQPLSNNELKIKPESQRIMQWFNMHSTIDLKLKVDDVVIYRKKAYRVMNEGLYDDYGYLNYHLVEDFTGNGPYEPTEEE